VEIQLRGLEKIANQHMTEFGSRRPRIHLTILMGSFIQMADKLIINIWGATVSADGIYAIAAAVIIVLVVVLAKLAANRGGTDHGRER
jgi:hypothetical protein